MRRVIHASIVNANGDYAAHTDHVGGCPVGVSLGHNTNNSLPSFPVKQVPRRRPLLYVFLTYRGDESLNRRGPDLLTRPLFFLYANAIHALRHPFPVFPKSSNVSLGGFPGYHNTSPP